MKAMTKQQDNTTRDYSQFSKAEAIKEIEKLTNTTYTHDNAYGGMLFYRNDKLKLIVSKNALSFVEETDKEIIHRVSALSKYLFKESNENK